MTTVHPGHCAIPQARATGSVQTSRPGPSSSLSGTYGSPRLRPRVPRLGPWSGQSLWVGVQLDNPPECDLNVCLSLEPQAHQLKLQLPGWGQSLGLGEVPTVTGAS